MSPPMGNISLARRFFGLVENQPLYLMVSIAVGLSVYTPIRHLLTASDVALDREARDYADHMAENPRTLARARRYEGGILGFAASLRPWPEVITLPARYDPQHHFKTTRW
ncbi:hypothetical protein Rsub_11065 [Raphidocelis subcapitata]|uniref:Uncharacterized protein n=1 Tax=Raphidocelis subcapitata TaxID=307507 RepID=A0A2V0PMF2_9CHLO|nr:hypothetical protein Rsub_11065 [Raphidocelis subcapitata]|eukprot:GBF98245.1 hypothetical protein Rsub_11065 [Raphidocelis subcapitata]